MCQPDRSKKLISPIMLAQMHLSRGLQHTSALVRYVTLCTLRRLLAGVTAATSQPVSRSCACQLNKDETPVYRFGRGQSGCASQLNDAGASSCCGHGRVAGLYSGDRSFCCCGSERVGGGCLGGFCAESEERGTSKGAGCKSAADCAGRTGDRDGCACQLTW